MPGPKWKNKSAKQNYKFDFVDVTDFEKKGCIGRMKYSLVFFIVLKSVLVYIGDMYTAGSYIILDKQGAVKPSIPFAVTKWIFVASIAISFVLLYIEVRKARKIIASRDISYAFTSTISYRYYTLTSYGHWCFFQEIIDRQNTQDKIAFFVFFAFKGWKRLMFCDGPRQLINAYTLYTIISQKGFTTNLRIYGTLTTQATLGVMIFTVTIFFVSACLLLSAFIVYLPLLCKIQGNLKEYCCYIIDKRLEQIFSRQAKNRKNQIKTSRNPNPLKEMLPTLPDVDNVDNVDVVDTQQGFEGYNGYNGKVPYNQMPINSPHSPHSPHPPHSPHSPHPPHSPPPMMYNNYGRPNRSQPPQSPKGMYDNGPDPYGNDSSQGGVTPIYNIQGQPIGTDKYPPRPDSNNSNSAYSDTSTKYSGNGRPPYKFSPQHQYPYQNMPPSGFNNNVDPYGGSGYAVPHPNNQHHNNQHHNYENVIDDYNDNDYNSNYNDYNNYAPPTQPPQNTQFENARQPSQRNDARYQQNRPYQAPGGNPRY